MTAQPEGADAREQRVQAVLHAYLEAVDREAPGIIEGLRDL